MDEPTNRERAEWARRAVEHFKSIVYGEPEYEPLDQAMYDLLANLRHLADTEGFDWNELLRMGDSHYKAEIYEERKGRQMGRASLRGVALGAVAVAPEVMEVIRLILDKAPASYKGAVAKQYALALLEDPRATESAEAVRVQLLYLRGNLDWWKGPEAREGKRILDHAIRDLKR